MNYTIDFTDLRDNFQVGKTLKLAEWKFRKEQREFEILCRRLRWRRTHQRQRAKKLAGVVTPRRLGPDAKDAQGRPIDQSAYFARHQRGPEQSREHQWRPQPCPS